MINIYEAQAANKRKSLVIMVFFILFFGAAVYFISQALGIYMGYEPGGLGMVGLALIVSGLMSLGGYYFSDRIVLTISGAKEANRQEHFNFYTVAENMAIAAGLPKPRLYVIEDTAPNAFATGRDPDHAVICATTGLLDKLSRTELEGVISHELSHIKNYDTRLMSIVAVLVGTIALLGDWLLRINWRSSGNRDGKKSNLSAVLFIIGLIFAILSPIIAQLIQLAISRRREFLADSTAISLTRQPQGLISALKKISQDTEALEAANKATAHLYIVNPFKGKERSDQIGWFANLFNTHPPVAKRIATLQEMV